MDEEIFEFAMVISVAPGCSEEWARALRGATAPRGIGMTIRTPSLAFFTVPAAQEFLAVEKAEQFLEAVAKAAGIRCALNAQPSGEV